MASDSKSNSIKTVMFGAILTGIALVIANSWGAAIKNTVNILVNKVRCGKYLILKKQEQYDKCKQQESLYGFYINAVITTILLSIIVMVLFGKEGVKSIKK